MKNLLYSILFLLGSLPFTGCYDLDTYPGDRVSQSSFYQTEERDILQQRGILRLNFFTCRSICIECFDYIWNVFIYNKC